MHNACQMCHVFFIIDSLWCSKGRDCCWKGAEFCSKGVNFCPSNIVYFGK